MIEVLIYFTFNAKVSTACDTLAFSFLGMDIASMPNANGVRKGKGSTDSRSG